MEPVISSKQENKIIPTPDSSDNLCRVEVKFEVKNAVCEISNALLRVMTCEHDGYSFDISYEDILTDDVKINKIELISNIKMIPVKFNMTDDEISKTSLSCNIKNDTNVPRAVTFGDLNSNISYKAIELIFLSPGCFIKLKNINIIRGSGLEYNDEKETARYFQACAGSIFPLDRLPSNRRNFSFGDDTVNVSPQHHEIRFEINAVLKTQTNILNIMGKMACTNIIQRLNLLLNVVTKKDISYFTEYDNKSVLFINETNTIAKLFDRVCINMYPDIVGVFTEVRFPASMMEIVVVATDSQKIMVAVINKCIDIYVNLMKQF